LFKPDGAIAIGSAGHPAPYRNGHEIQLPPGLPLGITRDVNWEDTSVDLQVGDRILWLSDGVIEARNSKRDLLGFQRAQELASGSASEIAGAAQKFGQEDDITVVSIRRQPQPAYVA
jgi:serine phosphatase RsbU (regulator of sigma subunit)